MRLVMNVGLPRTGTTSLRRAMTLLGWRAQEDPYQARRMELLLAGKVREAVEADLADGFTYLSEPYYCRAPEAVDAVRALGGVALCTLREREAWLASVRAQGWARTPPTPMPGWGTLTLGPPGGECLLRHAWLGWPLADHQARAAWSENWVAACIRLRAPGLQLCQERPLRSPWEQLMGVLRDEGVEVTEEMLAAQWGAEFPHENRRAK